MNTLFTINDTNSEKSAKTSTPKKITRKHKREIDQKEQTIDNIFGDEFTIKQTFNKQVVEVDTAEFSDEDAKKYLKKKTIPLKDKLALIKDRVIKKLGKQKDNIIVIRDRAAFHKYISSAIESGRIAIDTETNNSLDPVTCKIMGLCLYYPGGKQAYIPINHINPDSNEKLTDQCTENDINEELQRVNNSKILRIMHNGKFDYQVIKCTCGVDVPPDWDTIVAARLLDENEDAGLKDQYINHIDPTQDKYDISMLFADIPYAVVDPDIFAYYAATDSLMTDRLYLYQKPLLEACGPEVDKLSGKEIKGLYWLFKNVEMPIVTITAEMELTGVAVDLTYGAKLKEKYNMLIEETNDKITSALINIKPAINSWLLDPKSDARFKTKAYVPAKTKMSFAKIQEAYPETDSAGNRFKWGKPKADQLSDPINISSPVQLAILFYDVLKCPAVSKKSPRGTGEEEMKALKDWLKGQINKKEEISVEDIADEFETSADVDETNISGIGNKETYSAAYDLCSLILTLRGYNKLLTTYIETIPTLAEHWPDHRIRFHLNSLGTDTGRYASGGKIKYYDETKNEPVVVSGINIQNIPSHAKNIRMLFVAKTDARVINDVDNTFIVPEITEVETTDGFKYCRDIQKGTTLLVDGAEVPVKNINYNPTSRDYTLEI